MRSLPPGHLLPAELQRGTPQGLPGDPANPKRPGTGFPPLPQPQAPGPPPLTPALGPGLYQPVIEGQRLHDGGVCLRSFLELLQGQLPVSILQAERGG